MSDRIIVMQRSIAGELEAGPQESDIMFLATGEHDVREGVAGRAARGGSRTSTCPSVRAAPAGGASGGLSVRRRLAPSTSGPVFIVLIVVFIACLIAVTIHDGGTSEFLSVDNVREMFVRSVALGIVAAGQTLVILGRIARPRSAGPSVSA